MSTCIHEFACTVRPELLDDFVKLMDEQNIAVCVSLDGGMGDAFDEHKKYLWTKYRDRFVIFANIDWRATATPTIRPRGIASGPTSAAAWPRSWPSAKNAGPAG